MCVLLGRRDQGRRARQEEQPLGFGAVGQGEVAGQQASSSSHRWRPGRGPPTPGERHRHRSLGCWAASTGKVETLYLRGPGVRGKGAGAEAGCQAQGRWQQDLRTQSLDQSQQRDHLTQWAPARWEGRSPAASSDPQADRQPLAPTGAREALHAHSQASPHGLHLGRATPGVLCPWGLSLGLGKAGHTWIR